MRLHSLHVTVGGNEELNGNTQGFKVMAIVDVQEDPDIPVPDIRVFQSPGEIPPDVKKLIHDAMTYFFPL